MSGPSSGAGGAGIGLPALDSFRDDAPNKSVATPDGSGAGTPTFGQPSALGSEGAGRGGVPPQPQPRSHSAAQLLLPSAGDQTAAMMPVSGGPGTGLEMRGLPGLAAGDAPLLRAALDMVGASGQAGVERGLAEDPDPAAFIARLQDAHGLGAYLGDRPSAVSGLLFLDLMGVPRALVAQRLVEKLRAALLKRIADARLGEDQLRALLVDTFPYFGVGDLAAVPQAVLARTAEIPEVYLAQLCRRSKLTAGGAEDAQGAEGRFPLAVQRQMWQYDPECFRRAVMPHLRQFVQDAGPSGPSAAEGNGALVCSPMDLVGFSGSEVSVCLAEVASAAAQAGFPMAAVELARHMHGVDSKERRRRSSSVAEIAQMIGSSGRLYVEFLELCLKELMTGEETAANIAGTCAARHAVLMALHDGGTAMGLEALRQLDACYLVAWLLDGAVTRGFLSHNVIIRELGPLVDAVAGPDPEEGLNVPQGGDLHVSDLEKVPKVPSKSTKKSLTPSAARAGTYANGHLGMQGAAALPKLRIRVKDFMSEGRERGAALLGMTLRDPGVLHMLLSSTVRCLDAVVRQRGVPAEDTALRQLSRLLTLATKAEGTRGTRGKEAEMGGPLDGEGDGGPSVSGPRGEFQRTLLPLLASMLVDRELDPGIDVAPLDMSGPGSLYAVVGRVCARNVPARKVTLQLLLWRCSVADPLVAEALASLLPDLAAAEDHWVSGPELVQEELPFVRGLADCVIALTRQQRNARVRRKREGKDKPGAAHAPSAAGTASAPRPIQGKPAPASANPLVGGKRPAVSHMRFVKEFVSQLEADEKREAHQAAEESAAKAAKSEWWSTAVTRVRRAAISRCLIPLAQISIDAHLELIRVFEAIFGWIPPSELFASLQDAVSRGRFDDDSGDAYESIETGRVRGAYVRLATRYARHLSAENVPALADCLYNEKKPRDRTDTPSEGQPARGPDAEAP